MISNVEWVSKIDNLISFVEDSRFTYSRQWYINKAFYENNHFVMWNRFTRTIDRVSPAQGTVLRCVPKTRRQIDAVNNMILSAEIRWIVIPDGMGAASPQQAPPQMPQGNPQQAQLQAGQQQAQAQQDEDKNAIKINHFLQEKWQHWNVRHKLDDLVLNALLYNVSYAVVGFDKQVGDIFIDIKDAFDVYHPVYIDDLEDAPFIIVTYLKNIADVRDNPDYKNTKDMVPDNKKAQSEYKELRMNDKFADQHSQYDEGQTIILKVGYFKIKDKSGTKIKVITTAGGQKLKEQILDQSQYPVVMYKPQPGDIFAPAWIEKYISLNKSLDVFVSQIENFMNLMVRGRWAKQRGNNITRMTNQDGEWLEYDSAPPVLLEIPTLPSFPFIHTGNLEKWLQEMGVSTVAMGAQPKGIRAYKAIESLKQSDFANLRVPVDNLKDTLQKITEKVLDYAANYYLDPQMIYRSENDKQANFNVIGEAGASLMINKPMMESANPPVVIKKSFRVKTVVDSGLSYTEEGKRDTLQQLFQEGIIGKQALLEGFKFSNIAEVLEQSNAELQVSMVETPDFQILPDQMKQIILKFLQEPATSQINPLAQAQRMKDSRKKGKASIKKG